ncbi:MAG TPA: DUF3467 domain-containing protein [Pirellulaceae bacterium]|nr:DUF3467 domain-containing protein [Pirellulaceae bacterium]
MVRVRTAVTKTREQQVYSMSQPNQPNSEGNSQQVQMQHVTARVPESVSRGAFSTGVIVMTGGSEFILDFVQNIGGPPQVAARVVMPHGALPQFAEALKKNLGMYTERFGPPPELPKPPQPAKPQSAQELYDELKLPDSLLSGAYANGVMIGHTASEFKLDFLTNLFPHSAVSARVYLSAPQVPRLLESLISTFQQFQERVRQQQAQQPQAPPPPRPESSEDELG